MPMRHAVPHMSPRHWSVETRDARMRRLRRHPDHPDACLFLSAEVNPDYYYNDNDDPNVHRPSPPCSLVGANDATALCRQHA